MDRLRDTIFFTQILTIDSSLCVCVCVCVILVIYIQIEISKSLSSFLPPNTTLMTFDASAAATEQANNLLSLTGSLDYSMQTGQMSMPDYCVVLVCCTCRAEE